MPGKIGTKGQTQLEVLQRMTPEQRRPVGRPAAGAQAPDGESPPAIRADESGRAPARAADPRGFRDLPEERREKVRALFGTFRPDAPRRRMMLREEIRALGEPDDKARQERMSSEEYRNRYSVQEQNWLAGLSEALHSK